MPKAVDALKEKRIVLVSGGWRHTAAADDAGRLYTWGWNKVRATAQTGSPGEKARSAKP